MDRRVTLSQWVRANYLNLEMRLATSADDHLCHLDARVQNRNPNPNSNLNPNHNPNLMLILILTSTLMYTTEVFACQYIWFRARYVDENTTVGFSV